MNSYNENLHYNVVASLQSQILDKKKDSSAENAAMFTLYHSQGAMLTAGDHLESASEQRDAAGIIKLEAVRNSNLSVNLLASATQANDYLKQSVTNTAVSAANVQVAANAIVQLASDIGSIYSILHAADFDTDIYQLAEEVRGFMDDTAYEAVQASEFAMQASVLTSSVSGSTVLDKCKANNDMMGSMLKITTGSFDNATQLFAAANANLATVSAAEKMAEGALLDKSVDAKASNSAYWATNKNLNLGLAVWPVKGEENSKFGVIFDLIQSPFEEMEDENDKKKKPTVDKEKPPLYPVQDYYLILVKTKLQSTFSAASAETIILDSAQQKNCIALSDLIDENKKYFKHVFDINKIKGKNDLNDSEGKKIETGVPYVAFVVAVYCDDYKRRLNNYEVFLSAPSEELRLANHLAVAQFNDPLEVHIKPHADVEKPAGAGSKHAIPGIRAVSFTVEEKEEFEVEYRCMFLPVGNELTRDNLNNTSIREHNDEIAEIQKIARTFDEQIVAAEARLTESRAKIQELTGGEHVKKISKVLQDTINNHRAFKKQLQDLVNKRDNAIKAVNKNPTSKIDFVFNLTLAQQVSAGNYLTTFKKSDSSAEPVNFENLSSAKKLKLDRKITATKKQKWVAPIPEGTTDIFGNPLTDSKHYIPVILSVSAASEENLARYINSWTGYYHSPIFQY